METLHQELVFLNLEGLSSEDEVFIKDALSAGADVIAFPRENKNRPLEKVPFSSATFDENVEPNTESLIDNQAEYFEQENSYACEIKNGAAFSYGGAADSHPPQNVTLGPPSSGVSQVHLPYHNPLMYSHVALTAGYPASIPMVASQPNAYGTSMATNFSMPGLTPYLPQPRPVNIPASSDRLSKRMNHSPNKRGKNYVMGINGHMQEQYSTTPIQGFIPSHASYTVSQSYGTTYYTGHPTVQSATGAPYFMQTPCAPYPAGARFVYASASTASSRYTTPVVAMQSTAEVATDTTSSTTVDFTEEHVEEHPVVKEAETESGYEETIADETEVTEAVNETVTAEEYNNEAGALSSETPETSTVEEPETVGEGVVTTVTENQPQQKTWASLFRSSASGSVAPNRPVETTETQPKDDATTYYTMLGLPYPAQQHPVNTADQSSKRTNHSPNKRGKNYMTDPIMHQLSAHLASYLLTHSSVALLPRGLTNKNNWCYINASLQALLGCPPFVHLIKSLTSWAGHRLGESTTPIMDGLVEFLSQFETIPIRSRKDLAAAKKEEMNFGTCFEPTSILKLLSNIRSETFKVEGRQEDAEEFLSCLLNGLHDEMVEVLKLAPATSSPAATNAHNGDLSSNVNGDDDWQLIGPKNRSCVTRSAIFSRTPISDLFLGQMRSALYQAGSQTTATLQPFFSLQLDIQSERVKSVREALEALATKEPLTGYVCSKTGQEVEALRQTTLEELPPVLLLHLKCFVYNKSGGCQKLAKPIEFSADLELGKELLSPNLKNKVKERQRQYKLFAVVYHDGKEATKGHYVTEVLHSGLKTWLRFDDSIIRPIPDGSLFKYKEPRMPYLLFYRRADTLSSPAAAARSEASTSPAVVGSARGTRN